jgi:hypothetical protein
VAHRMQIEELELSQTLVRMRYVPRRRAG